MRSTLGSARANAGLSIQFRHRAVKTFSYEGVAHLARRTPIQGLYAFDPRRVAILLIGGDKTGDDRWYDKYVPLADKIYEEHIEALKKENN